MVFSTTRRWSALRYGKRVSSSTSAPLGTTGASAVLLICEKPKVMRRVKLAWLVA